MIGEICIRKKHDPISKNKRARNENKGFTDAFLNEIYRSKFLPQFKIDKTAIKAKLKLKSTFQIFLNFFFRVTKCILT